MAPQSIEWSKPTRADNPTMTPAVLRRWELGMAAFREAERERESASNSLPQASTSLAAGGTKERARRRELNQRNQQDETLVGNHGPKIPLVATDSTSDVVIDSKIASELAHSNTPPTVDLQGNVNDHESSAEITTKLSGPSAAGNTDDYNSRLSKILIGHIIKHRPKLIEGTGNTPHVIDLKPYEAVLPRLWEIGYGPLACLQVSVSCKKSGLFSSTDELLVAEKEHTRAQEITEAMWEARTAINTGEYRSITNSVEIVQNPSQCARSIIDSTFTARPPFEQSAIVLEWLIELAKEAEKIHSRPSRWVYRFFGIETEVEYQEANKCGCKGGQMCELAQYLLGVKMQRRVLFGTQ